MRNARHRPRLRFVLLLLTLFIQPVQAEPEKVTFRFAPPDGTTFEQTLVTTKTTDLGAQGKRTDVTRAVVRLRFDKTADGYTLTGTPVAMTMHRDGQEVENPLFDVLASLTFTYRLDADGSIRAIEGYDVLADRLRNAFPDEAVFQALSKVLNAETMVAREKEDWSGRISSFSGGTYEIGSRWTTESPFALPNGETITFYTATELVGKEKCGDRDCVRIRFRYDTDASALGKLAGEVVSDAVKAAGAQDPGLQISKSKITGGGERLIDPATMLIHSESLERTMRMDMATPGGTTPVTQHEKREYTFEYVKGGSAKP
jgi:hypothetical protein